MKIVKINKIFQYFNILIFIFIFWYYFNIFYNELPYYTVFPLVFIIIPITTYILFHSFLMGFILQWIIFLNVNPYPLKNNNKLSIMNYISETYRPSQQFRLDKCNLKDLNYPILIKPIICSGLSRNIFILNNYVECIQVINDNKIEPKFYMTQSFLKDYNLELGISYEKYPWNKNGKILQIIEKTNKENIRSWKEEYIMNRNNLISEKLNHIMNNISNSIPNFYVGRYDIRCKNFEDLINGNFKIVEVNGTMGMELFLDDHFNWFFRRILIGIYNIFSLNGYNPVNLIICMYETLKSCIICNDWEKLLCIYS